MEVSTWQITHPRSKESGSPKKDGLEIAL